MATVRAGARQRRSGARLFLLAVAAVEVGTAMTRLLRAIRRPNLNCGRGARITYLVVTACELAHGFPALQTRYVGVAGQHDSAI